MQPVKITRKSETELQIAWQDGHQSVFSHTLLRDICPCASCGGEQILFKRYQPAPQDRETPGRYELAGVQPVGAYALQFQWKDGHDTGLYSWDYLRSQCPCVECSRANGSMNGN
jgi:DUF971 family protein